MHEFLHVDGLIFLALGIEAPAKVNPAQTSRAMQRSPTVQHVDLIAAEMDEEFFETAENIVRLICIEASRHYQVASDQEDDFDLSVHTAACREDELVVCVPSGNLICYFIELVDIHERARHGKTFWFTDITVVPQC